MRKENNRLSESNELNHNPKGAIFHTKVIDYLKRLGRKFAPRDEDGNLLKNKLAKHIVILSVLLVLFIGLTIFASSIYRIMAVPDTLFQNAAITLPEATPEEIFSTAAAAETPGPTPTPDPYDEMYSVADKSIMTDVVNVLLIGVDYANERATWKKYFYSDVMLVLAINFKENKVDMISIPRDTYAKIANKTGIYKLNSSVYWGGGVPGGFKNVCDSVSWVLGGVPVNYYIGVTMPVVKELVDSIGGVDYDVDVEIHLQGRTIKTGFQHLDGQQVLDYLRARKGIDNDLGRVNRQKKMLFAVFKKLKATKQIFDVPNILKSFEGKAYTNLTFEQIAALAVTGYKLDESNIKLHTMSGTLTNIFNWNFVITDQTKRVELIKEIYGIDVPKRSKYSLAYCRWQWAVMLGEAYISKVRNVLKKDDQLAEPLRKLTPEQHVLLEADITALNNAIDAQKSSHNYTSIDAAETKLKQDATLIFKTSGYSVNWFVNENPGKARLTG